ncbi:hypothetical protein AQI88_07315 [Streptomyces cellostaticus]|uniref:Short-chain dehydrogenase n=1 Tax=Streptomyces cellostaticus TaxID=67285 RepID=A0A101NQ71_9ACTN|nr:hypothetical protein [Streptomyces cellostaticus]KUM97393.1 hypothetical protein AQI88_07315 [Streptomyces cellostaticus]GHI04152.1 hypothetical protein Scel_24730 [Streptomyces cellostaticus]
MGPATVRRLVTEGAVVVNGRPPARVDAAAFAPRGGAAAVAFHVSSDTAYVNGRDLVIDGGWVGAVTA